MPLVLRPRSLDALPVSLAGATPDALAEKSLKELEQLPIWQGNRQLPLAELFEVAGTATDLQWRLEGDFSSVHHIASGMRRGEVHLAGDAGRHAGQEMRGGMLVVEGTASDWLGAAMRGGTIDVDGDAGDHTGGALVAAKVGVRGGRILVRGNVGTHAAERMRRGWITVLGDCGEWAGHQMRAGTLMVFGNCGPRPGASMRRGTIALLGGAPELLPTFRYACDYAPQALGLMLRDLTGQGIAAAQNVTTDVAIYNGDLLEGGRGEVLVARG
ncbi:formylmethanofuran dehydrogenase subunit C [Aeoliella sp.]|uniref:formylmethanofuran dehydrogenase subunit C n=1 Tax=Aeoliella sp. TaxID=2795800 RepID=UPI003CCB7B27